MKCPQCKHEIVRTVEPTNADEARRVTWECKCSVGGAHGTVVEWIPEGNVTARGRLIPKRAR